MNLPKDAAWLGVPAGPLELRGTGAEIRIELTPEEQRRLAALSAPAGLPAAGRVYLVLDHIRGRRDALVLNAYINLPESDRPGDYPQLLAGSMGLYGLRRASLPQGESEGPGLAFVFDITPILAAQPGFAAAGEVRVSIRASHALPELPAAPDLIAGCIGIYYLPPG